VRIAAPTLLPVFRSRLQGELLALMFVTPEAEWAVDELAKRVRQPYAAYRPQQASSGKRG
jgi:hypothetical protein